MLNFPQKSGVIKKLKTIISIISVECRPRKSKAVGFGLVEETQFDKLPNEYEEVIQSASDSKAGPSGLTRSPPNPSPPSRRGRSNSIIPGESSVLQAERSSEEDARLTESFTALRNALQDHKNNPP